MPKKNPRRHRLVVDGPRSHPRYGMLTIDYAYLMPGALVIGWDATKWGFGELSVRQNYVRAVNEAVPMDEPGYWVSTPVPGVHLDTEAMGPEFVGEVMKAFYWAQQSGLTVPGRPSYQAQTAGD